MVFDNFDNPKVSGPQAYDIKLYFPEVHHGSILITTRSSYSNNIGKVVSIRRLLDVQEVLVY